MSIFFSERLPIPSLKSYCTVSTLIFAASLLYAQNQLPGDNEDDNATLTVQKSVLNVYLEEPFCLWPLINMLYVGLFLFGKVIQKVVLGDLRVVEQQHLQDKFWNYVFYKMIFIFGVVNAQSVNEVLCWCAWFSMLGFWNMFGQLCKDRYQYLTSSPFTAQRKHVKLMALILLIFASSIAMATVAVVYGYPQGVNVTMFMLTECLLLGLKSLHMFSKYLFQLFELSHTGEWDTRSRLVYYVDIASDCVILTIDLAFHVHMLVWANVFLSMASLVLYWNIRSIVSDFKKRLKKHRLFKKIIKNVTDEFPMATEEELNEVEDHCAICWEALSSARKLPCSHYFHHSCLCSWLQQDVSCPTCRRSLAQDIGVVTSPNANNADDTQTEEDIVNEDEADGANDGNYFFFLDGRQIANWFPSFSIEVFHARNNYQDEDEVNRQVEQVSQLFPHLSRETIVHELHHSGGIDATIHNILEGNVANIVPNTNTTTMSTPEVNPTHTSSGVATANTNEETPPISSPPQTTTTPTAGEISEDGESLHDGESDDSSSANENARTLRRRSARRRYLAKPTNASRPNQAPPDTRPPQPPEREERRNIIIRAVERRHNNTS